MKTFSSGQDVSVFNRGHAKTNELIMKATIRESSCDFSSLCPCISKGLDFGARLGMRFPWSMIFRYWERRSAERATHYLATQLKSMEASDYRRIERWGHSLLHGSVFLLNYLLQEASQTNAYSYGIAGLGVRRRIHHAVFDTPWVRLSRDLLGELYALFRTYVFSGHTPYCAPPDDRVPGCHPCSISH
jgi:hypothetical protein